MHTLSGYKKHFYAISLSIVIILLLSLGCGEKAKGKDAESEGKTKVETSVEKSLETTAKKTRMMLPDFTLSDLDGKEYRFVDYIGKKPVLLVFTTTWCPHCIRAIPTLNRMFSERKDDCTILSIYVSEPAAKVRNMTQSRGIQYPVLIDMQGMTARTYRIQGVPTFVLVDIEGGMRYHGNEIDQALRKIDELKG